MNTIQIKLPVSKKIELIIQLTDYKKAMAFKLWCEHNINTVWYKVDPVRLVYRFNVICDDFVDCAKVETYLSTH